MDAQVTAPRDRPDRRGLPSRKVVPLPIADLTAPDSIEDRAGRYLDAAVRGVRSAEVADHFTADHGHERLTAVVRRRVVAWRTHLAADPDPDGGDPQARGLALAPTKVSDLPLPPLEPQALSAGQVRSLKNILDRLERFHQHKGRRRGGQAGMHGHGRPLRDRAIVYLPTSPCRRCTLRLTS